MKITDEVLGKAAFGNLTSAEMSEITGDANLIEFGTKLLTLLTRLQQQIEQYNRRLAASKPSDEDMAWYQRTGALKSRCVALWVAIRPRYRQLRAQAVTGGPGYRRAIEEHRATVLEDMEPTEADRRLWRTLDSRVTSDPQSTL